MVAIEERLKDMPAAGELKRNGELEIWLPPVPGKKYLVAVDPAGDFVPAPLARLPDRAREP